MIAHMFMYSYYNRREGKSIAVYEKCAQKREGKTSHFARISAGFAKKCKSEGEYLHPSKLTEPERYSQRKSG